MTAEHAPHRGTRRRNPATAPPGRSSGRPRDPAIEEAILLAARNRLASDGYSAMTIGDIIADAGVTRPTLYRRWSNKYELALDALRHALRRRREAHPSLPTDRLPPREAFTEAVRRLGLRQCDSCMMPLHGSFMGAAEREPGLLRQLREHGAQPCREELLMTLVRLQQRGAVRTDSDLETVVRLCFGSYFADYLRTGRATPADHAQRVAAALWPTIATSRSR
ncbi:TetR/AcrR family transcriptional regulator [Streptomyces sp. NPDC053474]|uniref:TetR/AcrR family transcriptional regulator n=1 Tax=Streptomyces sp. NPDC053474 TaxID=3365704 RepID=UPI0037CD9443